MVEFVWQFNPPEPLADLIYNLSSLYVESVDLDSDFDREKTG